MTLFNICVYLGYSNFESHFNHLLFQFAEIDSICFAF